MPVTAGAVAGVNVGRPPRASARTNDVEACKARRVLGLPGSLAGSWRRKAEQRLAVAATEQEDEPFQVPAQLADVIGGVADELFQRGGQAGGVAVEPAGEELQHFGEFGGAGSAELYFGHGITGFRCWWRRPRKGGLSPGGAGGGCGPGSG